MSAVQHRPADQTRPLVAVLCSVPLLREAVGSALEFAEVLAFEGGRGDLAGLLRWLRPDVLIVDCEEDARQAQAFAQEHGLPVLFISLRERALRVLRGDAWVQVGNGEGPTPETVRNVIAGALFARGHPDEGDPGQ